MTKKVEKNETGWVILVPRLERVFHTCVCVCVRVRACVREREKDRFLFSRHLFVQVMLSE